jgi:4-amino-4-deoxy-L-arabinose transferase-like glycosyltransferase
MNARAQGRYWRHQLLVLTLLILGFALRFPGIGQIPPGLYHDEAQHGLDALDVLDGHLSLYFEANNGREPLFVYLVTTAVAVLGRNPIAIRLPSAFVGFVTLAAIYDLARTLWRREAGLWALAVLSVTFWHVHLSRVGFRSVLLPLFTTCYLSQAAKAIQRHGSRSKGHWIAAGALYGASWYTYIAARFTPIAIAVILTYGFIFHRDEVSRRWRGGLTFTLAALVVLLPLGAYTLWRPDVVLARSGQVSIFNEEINGGNFWATLARQTVATARMFVGQGDRIWRHNLARRPVWDPALGLVFLMGVGIALARFAQDQGGALALLWTATMALPTLLAEDAPHFLRGVGLLPTASLLPTIGLEWLSERLRAVGQRRTRALAGTFRALPRLIPAAIIAFGLASTSYDYFFRYAQAPLTYHWLEGGPVDLAETINTLRGQGWNGERMQRDAHRSYDVYLDAGLWESWSAIPYLVPASAVNLLPVRDVVPLDQGAAFIVWPYDANRRWEEDVFPFLPRPAYVRVERGPAGQGDLDPQPYTLAMITRAEPIPEVPAPVARFENGILLRAALVQIVSEDAIRVNLWWEPTGPIAEPYTVFAHYNRDGARIAQHDGQPGLGHLPTTAWVAGDLILDIHPISGVVPNPEADTLRVGLYDAETGKGVVVYSPDGEPYADAVEVPVIIAAP